ncbi:unnamed protein product, partial [Brachionus calyciflorus]
MEYFKRFYGRYGKEISLVVAIASFGIVFYKPIKYIYYDSTRPEVLNDPRRLQMQLEAEKRKELIIQKYKEYKECKDPDEKKRIYAELSKIHESLKMYENENCNEITSIGYTFLEFLGSITLVYFVSVTFGAYLIEDFYETLTFNLLGRLLIQHEFETKLEKYLVNISYGAIVGAWFGALVIPLDWDRWWQKWPLSCLFGAFVGKEREPIEHSLRVNCPVTSRSCDINHLPLSVIEYLEEKVNICQPEAVYICDGSEEEYKDLLKILQEGGWVQKLEKMNNCWLALTDPKDVARVESRTFMSTKNILDTIPVPKHDFKEA